MKVQDFTRLGFINKTIFLKSKLNKQISVSTYIVDTRQNSRSFRLNFYVIVVIHGKNTISMSYIRNTLLDNGPARYKYQFVRSSMSVLGF